MNIAELEKLAKDSSELVVREATPWKLEKGWLPETDCYELQPYFQAVAPSNTLAMIELLREMGVAIEAALSDEQPYINRCKEALGKYKEMTK